MTVLCLLVVALSLLDGPDEQRAALAAQFGFAPLEVYKVKDNAHNLRLADVDGDKRIDIALFNAVDNRIELFLQPDPAAPAPEAAGLERNELADHGRLRNVRVPVSHRVASFQVAELTGDSLPDIVFFGEPKELVVLPGKGGGEFAAGGAQRAPEGQVRGHSVATGDFNGDGRTDVGLLAEGAILLFSQRPEGGLAPAERLAHALRNPILMLTTDLNGDGRDDLILSVDDEENGAAVFLQDAAGRLGAMRRIRAPRVTSVTVAPRPAGDDIFCIEQNSARLKQYRWGAPLAAAGAGEGLTLFYSYPTASKSRRRPLDVGDLTGDGRADLLAADPDAAQLFLFKGADAGFEPPIAFPGLQKTLDVQIGDADGDGNSEAITVSREEKMIGVSRFVEGRLTFPAPMPTRGTPLAVTCGTLRGDGKAHVAYVSTGGAEAGERHALGGANKVTEVCLQPAGAQAPERSFEIESLDEDPSGLRFADVNQDGLNDLLLFVPFAPLRVWLQAPDGGFERLSGAAAREGLVKEAALEDFALADVTGDGKAEVLLAQKNLARALAVRDGQWTVVDQYNPESADAQLKGLAVIPRPGEGPTIVLYDRKAAQALILERREDQTYGVSRKSPLGPFETTAMMSAPLAGGSGVVVADAEKLALLAPYQSAETLVEQRAYESEIRGARIADSTVGDLNGDGSRDIVLIDMRRAFLQILTTAPDGAFWDVLSFQVFQGKRFSAEPERAGEPREALIGDVTNDGADDIALLVHDRLIVYPSQR